MKGIWNFFQAHLALILEQIPTNTFIDMLALLWKAPSEMQYQLWAIVDGVPVRIWVGRNLMVK